MKIVNSGVPSIVNAQSSVTGQGIAADLVTPQPLVTSFGQLVADMLGKLASAAVVVIDPNSRKVTAISGAEATALREAIEVEANSVVLITPDAGQSGTSLTFQRGAAEDVHQLTVEAIDGTIEPVKPKRSVSSLVSSILGKELPSVAPILIVDQVNGVVKVAEMPTANSAPDVLAGLANAGDRMTIAITDDSEAPGAPKLPFEGGAV